MGRLTKNELLVAALAARRYKEQHAAYWGHGPLRDADDERLAALLRIEPALSHYL